MKIAVTATGENLSSEIDPRFGRALRFMIVDPDTMETELVENAQNLNLPQGAGIQAAQTIASQKVEVLITGNCGPKAFKVLEAAGIKVITEARGRIDEVIEQFKKGELKHADEANVEGHWV